MTKKNIIVIGGGPAGMMAALTAKTRDTNVILVEKNASPGRKLLLTGNTRCNMTNSCDLDTFLTKFGKNGLFLRDAFKNFFNTDLIRFFEKRGLKCKIDDEKKVFPYDDKAISVLNTLQEELERKKVTVMYSATVQTILIRPKNTVRGIKLTGGKTLSADSVILATGGVSYPATGSTGDGLKLANKLGHTIISLRPGLVPLTVKENYPKQLMGLALSNVSIKILHDNRKVRSKKGDMIFTATGISGPAILSLSKFIPDLLNNGKTISISIDQFCNTSEKELTSELAGLFNEHPSKSVKNNLKLILPQRIGDLFLNISRIDSGKRSNQITQKERSRLVSLCKDLRLTVTGISSIKEAMVTSGGISLKEIDPRTMASRLVNGLYFAGEIIDIAGDTGGFNLQTAFSTGYLAGKSAAL